jgi:hypothetical protein
MITFLNDDFPYRTPRMQIYFLLRNNGVIFVLKIIKFGQIIKPV